jgi:hypothetical protein
MPLKKTPRTKENPQNSGIVGDFRLSGADELRIGQREYAVPPWATAHNLSGWHCDVGNIETNFFCPHSLARQQKQ